MKKILSICICFVFSLTLNAQKGNHSPRKGSKKGGAGQIESQVSRAVEKASHQKPKAREVFPASRPGSHTQVRPSQEGVASRLSKPGTNSVLGQYSPVTKGTKAFQKTSETEKTFHLNYGRSVLAVPDVILGHAVDLVEAGENEPAFTMTIIKTKHEGTEEIYGVIPTHAIPSDLGQAKLKMGIAKKFKAKLVLADGTVKHVNAEVVQISPSSMLDISLVKFDKETEALLEPLEISTILPKTNVPVYSPGYADGWPTLVDRTILGNAFIYIATNLIDIEGNSRGFCGAPVIREGKVIGFHTGSSAAKQASYATQAHFVNNLIEAFQTGGYSFYDLVLDGHVLTTLNVDEYISAFGFANEMLELIYKEDFAGKYSESRIRAARAAYPQAKYLILHSREAYWKQSTTGDFALIENRRLSGVEKSRLREHVYDLEKHELVATPAQATRDFPMSLFMDPTPQKGSITFNNLIDALWNE